MTLSNVCGLFTKIILSLLTVAALSQLLGCSPTPLIKPTPPRIDCEAGSAALIPPLPATQALEAEWITTVLGLYAGEVTKRKAVRQCLADLRNAGVIR